MKTSRGSLVPALILALGAAGTVSCVSDGFGRSPNPPRLVVELDAVASNPGARDAPLPLLINKPTTFRVTVRAFAPNGTQDTTFNRYVRVSSKPGAVAPLSGPETAGRNVLLTNGESVPVDVAITNAYGVTYIVADDFGYVPVDPLRKNDDGTPNPPACANGIDDDGDGVIDSPADDGCAFANDDDERGGTFTEGVSQPIYFKLPRIADLRGLVCDDAQPPSCSGNGATPYPKQPIQVDTGYREDGTFAFDTVVTRISSNGFYVNDIGDTRGGFTSLFSFNFNAPPRMRTCDRMKTYGGTASEFFGFTQMSYPTWTLEEWDPAKRPCLVPEPVRLSPTVIGSAPELLRVSGGLVVVETDPLGTQKLRVTPKFGPGDVPKTAGGLYVATPEASNCDFDKNGRITFTAGNPEAECSTACTADPECTEWSNYVARSTFRLTVSDSNGRAAAVQADASASPAFDPVALKGQEIRSFSGTLSFFSGGSQFTIEARCKDDVIVSLQEKPFPSDRACTTDTDCTAAIPTGLALSADYKCVPLGAGKACRKLDAERPDVRQPPPLACVFPRTFLDNNPQ
jgi:hypothetical protein